MISRKHSDKKKSKELTYDENGVLNNAHNGDVQTPVIRRERNSHSNVNTVSIVSKRPHSYMDKVNDETEQLRLSRSGNTDGSQPLNNIRDTDSVSNSEDEYDIEDKALQELRNKTVMTYDNHLKYMPRDDIKMSDVSGTPIMSNFRTQVTVSDDAGRVQFHGSDGLEGKKKSKKNVQQKIDVNKHVHREHYYDVLLQRYNWLPYLLQRGLKLSTLNDESLWNLNNYCSLYEIEIHSYSRVLFSRHGADMFNAVNWLKEG